MRVRQGEGCSTTEIHRRMNKVYRENYVNGSDCVEELFSRIEYLYKIKITAPYIHVGDEQEWRSVMISPMMKDQSYTSVELFSPAIYLIQDGFQQRFILLAEHILHWVNHT